MGTTTTGLTNGGRTTHYQFEYDDSLSTAVGRDRTNALMGAAEADFALMASWFPNVTPFKPPRKVQVLPGKKGAEWGAFGNDDVQLKEEDATVNELRYLMVSEVTEQFMSARGNGWFDSFDEGSRGEALSRFLAIQFQLANRLGAAAPPGFGLTINWLNSSVNDVARPDFVTTSEDDNQPDLRNGCGTLFLFFLHDQLGFSINQIIDAGSKTLADVFHTLTGRTNAFSEFRSVIDAHHPVGVPVMSSGESIFPVVDLVSFSTLNELTSGYWDTTVITFTSLAKADFTIALSSADPRVVQVPSTVLVKPGMGRVPVIVKTTATLAKPVTVNITATYAGRTITLPVMVAPPRVTNVVVTPASVVAGQAAAGVVELNKAPMEEGVGVTLSSSSPGFLTVDKQVSIMAGSSSGAFHLEAPASVLSFAPAHVTIQATCAGSSATAAVTVNPSVVTGILQSVTLMSTTVTGGQSCSGLVQLQSPVASDTVVGLQAMEPGTGLLGQPGNLSTVATVQQPKVTITAGNTTAQFSVATKPVAAIHKAIIVAGTSAAGALTQKSATLTITP